MALSLRSSCYYTPGPPSALAALRGCRTNLAVFRSQAIVLTASVQKCCSRVSVRAATRGCNEDDLEGAAALLEDDNVLSSDDSEVVDEHVEVSIERLSQNRRRISASVEINSSLETVWNVLTDYQGLADFIPGLASSQILEKREDGARLLQIGEQALGLGVKFRAKGVIEVTEIPFEVLPDCIRRDINFDMVEGDFKIFKGTWRIEQFKDRTVLWYLLEVQPKLWLPVSLVEGRLSREVKTNLACIRDRASSLEPEFPLEEDLSM